MAIRFAQCRGNAVNLGGSGGGGEIYNTTYQHYWYGESTDWSNGSGVLTAPDNWEAYSGRLNSDDDEGYFQGFIHPSYGGGDFTFYLGVVLPTIANPKTYTYDVGFEIEGENQALGAITLGDSLPNYNLGPASFTYKFGSVVFTPGASGAALPNYFRGTLARTDTENGNPAAIMFAVTYALS